MNEIRNKYQFVTNQDQTQNAIGISSRGKFNGVIYRYGRVSFGADETPEGHLPLKFEYDILDPNGLERDEFNQEFFHLIGDILVDVISVSQDWSGTPK